MGNKLCKKKTDAADNPKSPTPFDRIITRLHLRPHAWKSDPQLDKQVNRVNAKNAKNGIDSRPRPLSKSSDWTDASLEVPDHDEPIHLRNPKLNLIFDNDECIPTPPPRQNKRGFREKIEAVAKSSLQALQSKKPVEEPLCIKKTFNYSCPLCDKNCIHGKHEKIETKKSFDKEKRRKNLSVVSLPNYSELKFSIASDEKKPCNSAISLPGESKKLSTVSAGKFDNYITRCRSFGSLLPYQLLHKLKTPKAPPDVESDDSFGGLEDWDLRIIEHYNPKDTSLPRPRKSVKSDNAILADIESLIVNDEEIESPQRPMRRSESLVKKINREGAESASKRRSNEMLNKTETKNPTPPPSPVPEFDRKTVLPVTALPMQDETGKVEHSSLMKILEEFSIRDKLKTKEEKEAVVSPSLVGATEDFINAEKGSADACFVKRENLALNVDPIRTQNLLSC